MKEDSAQKLARRAGILYLIIVICGFYGIMYVPSQVLVKNDAAATFQHLVQHAYLFRTGTFSQVISSVVFLMLALTFYQIFKNTSHYLSILMLLFVAVQIPVTLFGESLNIAAMMVAQGNLMVSSELALKQEIVYLLLRTSKYSMVLNMTFWGLWLIPLGLLILKSGYMPRIIGIMLVLGGVAYLLEVTDFLLFEDRLTFVTKYMPIFYSSAELTTMVWLLFKSVFGNWILACSRKI